MGDQAVAHDPIMTHLSTDEAERVYRVWPELRTTCPTCKTPHRSEWSGTYRWHGQDYECDCDQQTQLAKHYTAAGIGQRFQRLSLADYHGTSSASALEEVGLYLTKRQAYIDAGVGIILHGPYGTGKTFLANMVLKELVRSGVKCYATTFSDTVEAFTSTWGDKDQKRWFADKFKYTKVLLLDDLGKETRSNNSLPQTTFDSILRSRTQDLRPTILTTNITLRDLDIAGYGAAALSLLKESCVAIEVKSDDFRPHSSRRTLDEVEVGETRPIC